MKKGFKHSEETKRKISESTKGHKRMTKEVTDKITASKRRNGTLQRTEETKRKISIAQKNLSPEKRANILYGQRNNRYSPEYAKKLSDTKLGTINPQSKLTEKDIVEIRKLWATGNYTTTTIADKYPVSRQSIADIVYGRTWKQVK